MAGTFKTINVADKNIQLIQDNVGTALTPLQAIPMVGGNMLTSIDLTSGQDNKVAHKLGRTPQFWILARQNADSRVWESDADSSFLVLQCSNSCTVSLWVN